MKGLLKRCLAFYAIGGMLMALFYAPFFHVHESEDHDHGDALVHAHFPEIESHHPDSPEGSVESEHSHEHARLLDVLAARIQSDGFCLIAVLQETSLVPSSSAGYGFISIVAPRAHSPPGGHPSIPRSPPVVSLLAA
jgi:hypothetical protein